MSIHPKLYRLADSLPVILALEAEGRPVASPDIITEPPLPPAQVEAHLLVLESEGWAVRRQEGHVLSPQGRDWLRQSGNWYMWNRPYRPNASELRQHHRVQQDQHPAQPILWWLSSDWPVFIALPQLTHATASQMIKAPHSPAGWKPQHLDELVRTGLLAADRTPTERGGPLYVIDHFGERWMRDPVLTSIRFTAHALGV